MKTHVGESSGGTHWIEKESKKTPPLVFIGTQIDDALARMQLVMASLLFSISSFQQEEEEIICNGQSRK